MGKKTELIICAFILVAVFLIYKMRDTFIQIGTVFGMTVFFSLLLTPICEKLLLFGVKNRIACLIAVLGFVLLLASFLVSFVPYLITHAVILIRRISPTVSMMLEQGRMILSARGFSFLPSVNDVMQMFTTAMAPLTAGIARGGLAVISSFGKLILSLAMTYYLLTIRQEIGRHVLMCIPTRHRRAFLAAIKGSKNALFGYLSGLMKTSVFVGGATFIGLMLLGVKEAIILAVFMGLLEGFPYIGPIMGSIPILLSVIPMGLGKTIMALIMIIAIQQFESGVIGPYFTASSTSIHPLSAIISVFVGGSLFGLAGILFAVPAVVITRSILWSVRSAKI